MGESRKVRALILSESPLGEQDKRLSILGAGYGRMSAIAKGAKKQGSRLGGVTQLFFWCDFLLEQSRGSWYVREAVPIEAFYPLRTDVEKLAWASWMGEVTADFAMEGEAQDELLRLLLRGLRALQSEKLAPKVTASAFVLRAMCIAGLRPDLSRCACCGSCGGSGVREERPDPSRCGSCGGSGDEEGRPDPSRCGSCGDEKKNGFPFLSARAGGYLCYRCQSRFADRMSVVDGLDYTLRYVFDCPDEKLYAFTLNPVLTQTLFCFARDYVSHYLMHEQKSLTFLEALAAAPF